MKTEKISPENIKSLTKLMLELWPECNFEEEYANCKRMLGSPTETCFLVKKEERYIAFIQLSIRSEHVDGATSSPVAYLEGIYVRSEYQRSGIGKNLVVLGEKWAKQKGCVQYASDAELHNKGSIDFHKKTGFREVSRIVSFIKDITK